MIQSRRVLDEKISYKKISGPGFYQCVHSVPRGIDDGVTVDVEAGVQHHTASGGLFDMLQQIPVKRVFIPHKLGPAGPIDIHYARHCPLSFLPDPECGCHETIVMGILTILV